VSVIQKPVSNTKTIIKHLKTNVECDISHITLREDSLKRHIQTKHQESRQCESVCVDEESAIFMVRKSRSGVPSPIHVQKKLHGSNPKVACESNDCCVYFAVSGISSRREALCEHLKAVDIDSLRPSADITANAIELYANDETCEISQVLKEDTIQKCISLINTAIASSKKAIVPWIFPKYVHLSVFFRKMSLQRSF